MKNASQWRQQLQMTEIGAATAAESPILTRHLTNTRNASQNLELVKLLSVLRHFLENKYIQALSSTLVVTTGQWQTVPSSPVTRNRLTRHFVRYASDFISLPHLTLRRLQEDTGSTGCGISTEMTNPSQKPCMQLEVAFVPFLPKCRADETISQP